MIFKRVLSTFLFFKESKMNYKYVIAAIFMLINLDILSASARVLSVQERMAFGLFGLPFDSAKDDAVTKIRSTLLEKSPDHLAHAIPGYNSALAKQQALIQGEPFTEEEENALKAFHALTEDYQKILAAKKLITAYFTEIQPSEKDKDPYEEKMDSQFFYREDVTGYNQSKAYMYADRLRQLWQEGKVKCHPGHPSYIPFLSINMHVALPFGLDFDKTTEFIITKLKQYQFKTMEEVYDMIRRNPEVQRDLKTSKLSTPGAGSSSAKDLKSARLERLEKFLREGGRLYDRERATSAFINALGLEAALGESAEKIAQENLEASERHKSAAAPSLAASSRASSSSAGDLESKRLEKFLREGGRLYDRERATTAFLSAVDFEAALGESAEKIAQDNLKASAARQRSAAAPLPAAASARASSAAAAAAVPPQEEPQGGGLLGSLSNWLSRN